MKDYNNAFLGVILAGVLMLVTGLALLVRPGIVPGDAFGNVFGNVFGNDRSIASESRNSRTMHPHIGHLIRSPAGQQASNASRQDSSEPRSAEPNPRIRTSMERF